MKNLLFSIIIGTTMLLSGCTGILFEGAGVGADAFTYVAGNLSRVYDSEYQQSIRACTNVIEQLNFIKKEESNDGLITIIEGSMEIDKKVTIEVVFVDPDWTQIGVRTGDVGSANFSTSEQVHIAIAKELNLFKKRTSQASSPNTEINKPRRLRATSQKKKSELSEIKPTISYSLYDALPPPPRTNITPNGGIAKDTQTSNDLDEQSELLKVSALVNESDAPSNMHETVSAKMESNPESTQEMTGVQEKPIDDHANNSENKRDTPPPASETVTALNESDKSDTREITESNNKTVNDQEKIFENEHDAPSPTSEPPATPPVSDKDDTQEIMVSLEKQVISPTESKSKTFNYYPKSALTIHSGSYATLDDVISYAHMNPRAGVNIQAYNDVSDNTGRNLVLLQERVSEIRNYMILHGISEKTITSQIMETNNFLESNQTERSKSLSPQVEITIGDLDDKREMMGSQEEQVLSVTESRDKTFNYYPYSAQTIHSGSYGAIDDLLSYVDDNPVVEVDIRAYADASENTAHNIDLSLKRVTEIRNYLILQGMSEEIITAQVMEATNFLGSNQTEKLDTLNTFVEITIR